MTSSGLFRGVALAQGVYYAAAGAWPLVSLSTFEGVTGPKTDDWLVQTVGMLVLVVGLVLLLAGLLRTAVPEVLVLGAGSAAGFIAVDVYFVAVGRIPPVYLGDALVEALLVAGWALAFLRARGLPFTAGRPARRARV